MKRRKLILLSLSVILVLLTTFTVSYAWFTSATKAEATNISAKVQDIDKSILLSKNGIDYHAEINVNDRLSGKKMNPVQIAGDNQFTLLDGTAGDPAKDYISVTFYFKVSGLQKDSYLSMELDSILYQSTDHPRTLAQAFRNNPNLKEVIVHLGEALSMEVTPNGKATVTDLDNNTSQEVLMTKSKYYRFSLDNPSNEAGRDALFYYNNIKGLTGTPEELTIPTNYFNKYESTNLYGTKYFTNLSEEPKSRSAKVNLLELEKDKDYDFQLTFNFFLEGWDIDCFSFLAEQTFSTDLIFSLTDKE